METPEERRAYSKGYAAGKRAAKGEPRGELTPREHETLHDQVFCAVAAAMVIKGEWQTKGKTASTTEEYIELAKMFADAAVRAMRS